MVRGINFWGISDTHFGHDMLVKNGLRPLGFEEDILSEVYNHIFARDVVIHFGDVSFYNHQKWNKKFTEMCFTLGCRCWLIRGNHDKKTNSWYLDHGWDFVADAVSLKIYGLDLVLSHKPYIVNDLVTGAYDFNIHGHIHDGRLSCDHPQNLLVTHNIVNLRTLVGK